MHGTLNETRSSFQKLSLNLRWISNITILEVENIAKAATLKSFLHVSHKTHTVTFFVRVLFNIFVRKTLTDDFWGLRKI